MVKRESKEEVAWRVIEEACGEQTSGEFGSGVIPKNTRKERP